MVQSTRNLPSKEDMMSAYAGNMANSVHSTTVAFYDFSTEGINGESANIERAKFTQKQTILAEQQKQKEKDAVEQSADNALEEMQEQKEKQLSDIQASRQFGNFDFTHGDMDEALDEIIDNNKVWADKNGLTEEEAESALDHAIKMKLMTPEEREEYLNTIREENPKIADAIVDQAEYEAHEHNTAINTASSGVSAQTIDMGTDLISDFKEPSIITSTFTEEVANTGANAQSFSLDAPENNQSNFSLDKTSDVETTTKEVFSLDA